MAKALGVILLGLLVVACSTPEDPRQAARVQELIGQLRKGDDRARFEAADEIMRIGPAAKAAVPALIENIGDGHTHQAVNVSAINALLRIGPRAAMPPLVEALKSDNPERVSGALVALAGFGQAAKSAIPDIQKLLDNPKTRASAASTLKMIRDFP